MVKLGDVYESVENPLDNPEILQKIVAAYSKSDRTNLFSSSNLYSSLVKMNETKDSSKVDLSDRDTFFVETYNQWIDNILSLDDNQINYLETHKGMDARAMQEYLKSFGKVTSMEDIRRLKSNSLFNEDINGWELNDGWEHIKSQYISARTEDRISVKHRLYVGCQNQDMWKLTQLFKSKCEAQQIPFYFKLSSSSDRDDKMVIYADTDKLANYITALQEIAQENPEILQRCGEPPAMTGKIDGWIGIGDEPPKKQNGDNQSYNSIRAEIFEDAIEETILSELAELKGKDVVYKGKQAKINDLFIEQSTQIILDSLDEGKDKKSSALSNYGLTERDLSNPKFKEYLKTHLKKTIQQGINKLLEVKDKKSELAGSNSQAIFSIPTRDGKNISVNTYDMDAIIKSMVPILQEIDPNFMDKVKGKIQEKCKENGIDNTFCFQQGSKERFEKMDSQQPEKAEEPTIPLQTSQTKSTPIDTKTKSSATVIRSIEIADRLNPELLKQKIELPNGIKISARQYIQEFVAPHIPSDGKFILNNGSAVAATQYIEEYILGEGQQKYNGDISKLLGENTRSNDGTITMNGEKINSVDIVNSLNPELMQRKMKLPNGVEISATQYIQEIVAPNIPSDGKFILKSNGLGLSARQFIEEAVIFEGQEKYNGDIVAILDALTVANNGSVSVGTRTKPPIEKGLKQEMGVSQLQVEKLVKEQEDALRAEQEDKAKQKNEEQTQAQNEKSSQGKKLEMSDVKATVKESKVTTAETQKTTSNMKYSLEMMNLRKRSQRGEQLTIEQQQQLQEYEKQKQQREANKRKQNNKGMSLGL